MPTIKKTNLQPSMKPITSAPLLVLASLCAPAMAALVGDWNLEEGSGVTLEQVSLIASDALRTGVTWSTTDTPGLADENRTKPPAVWAQHPVGVCPGYVSAHPFHSTV